MSVAKEALRQQMLLRALWRDARPGVLAGWTRDGAAFTRGLLAYQAHAGALAERALAATYPTVQQLLGAESFAGLARAHWRQSPPSGGDLALWGGGLADLLATAAEQATDRAAAPNEEPYLPDVARLEWAVHRAVSAAQEPAEPQGLDRLADTDPSQLWLVPRSGTALLASAHPVASIWQAHRPARAALPDRFDAVRAALAAGQAEAALVWRRGWQVQVTVLPGAEVAFTAAVLRGRTLAQALDEAATTPDFDFAAFLRQALHLGWLAGASVKPAPIPAPIPAPTHAPTSAPADPP